MRDVLDLRVEYEPAFGLRHLALAPGTQLRLTRAARYLGRHKQTNSAIPVSEVSCRQEY